MRRTVAALALSIALTACGGTPRSPVQIAPTATPVVLANLATATLPAGTLTLRVGEQAPLDTGGATVRFVGVVEDSRCPANAQCIWQGRVVIELSVASGGQTTPLTLGTLKGFADAPATGEAAGHTLRIADLEPYPEGATAIPEERYLLTLVIS